jgi:hypothetical protein
MHNQINQFFYLPLYIGERIKHKIGIGKKGIIVYTLLYFSFSTFLSILTNGFDLWFIRVLIPSSISNYLLLGMLYVFFFIWRR